MALVVLHDRDSENHTQPPTSRPKNSAMPPTTTRLGSAPLRSPSGGHRAAAPAQTRRVAAAPCGATPNRAPLKRLAPERAAPNGPPERTFLGRRRRDAQQP